jgi:hypothetical protein
MWKKKRAGMNPARPSKGDVSSVSSLTTLPAEYCNSNTSQRQHHEGCRFRYGIGERSVINLQCASRSLTPGCNDKA